MTRFRVMDENHRLDWSTFELMLASRMEHPLPGEKAQYRMAHGNRLPVGGIDDRDFRPAAVLFLVYPRDGEACTVLIRRTDRDQRDRHRGQIGFPGGKWEEGDADLSASALREASEEVGISPESVRLVTPLTPLKIPVSRFHVHPFLGVTPATPAFRRQESEVESILEVPLRHFMEKANIKRTDLPVFPGITLRDVPYFDIGGQVLWGATAMIMSEFLLWWDDTVSIP